MKDQSRLGGLMDRCIDAISSADKAVAICRSSLKGNPKQVTFALLSVNNSIKQIERLMEEAESCDYDHSEDKSGTIRDITLSQAQIALAREDSALRELKEELEKAERAADEKERIEDINRFLAFAGKLGEGKNR